MLEWNQFEAAIEAKTPYGTYRITVGTPPFPVKVKLHANDPAMTFEGNHPTIIAAKAAAKTDEEYRTHMWETL